MFNFVTSIDIYLPSSEMLWFGNFIYGGATSYQTQRWSPVKLSAYTSTVAYGDPFELGTRICIFIVDLSSCGNDNSPHWHPYVCRKGKLLPTHTKHTHI